MGKSTKNGLILIISMAEQGTSKKRFDRHAFSSDLIFSMYLY